MYIGKALIGTVLTTLIWGIMSFSIALNQGSSNLFNTLVVGGIFATIATYAALRFVLREPKPDQTALPARRTRFEDWFESLDDDQLNALRHRLTDDYDEDYSSVGSLMNERKAKRS